MASEYLIKALKFKLFEFTHQYWACPCAPVTWAIYFPHKNNLNTDIYTDENDILTGASIKTSVIPIF